jgi:hypothetical protein
MLGLADPASYSPRLSALALATLASAVGTLLEGARRRAQSAAEAAAASAAAATTSAGGAALAGASPQGVGRRGGRGRGAAAGAADGADAAAALAVRVHVAPAGTCLDVLSRCPEGRLLIPLSTAEALVRALVPAVPLGAAGATAALSPEVAAASLHGTLPGSCPVVQPLQTALLTALAAAAQPFSTALRRAAALAEAQADWDRAAVVAAEAAATTASAALDDDLGLDDLVDEQVGEDGAARRARSRGPSLARARSRRGSGTGVAAATATTSTGPAGRRGSDASSLPDAATSATRAGSYQDMMRELGAPPAPPAAAATSAVPADSAAAVCDFPPTESVVTLEALWEGVQAAAAAQARLDAAVVRVAWQGVTERVGTGAAPCATLFSLSTFAAALGAVAAGPDVRVGGGATSARGTAPSLAVHALYREFVDLCGTLACAFIAGAAAPGAGAPGAGRTSTPSTASGAVARGPSLRAMPSFRGSVAASMGTWLQQQAGMDPHLLRALAAEALVCVCERQGVGPSALTVARAVETALEAGPVASLLPSTTLVAPVPALAPVVATGPAAPRPLPPR